MVPAHLERIGTLHRETDRDQWWIVALVCRVIALMRRAMCAILGHSMLMHFEPDRLSLRCILCGMQTRGWNLNVRPELRRTSLPNVQRMPRREADVQRRAA